MTKLVRESFGAISVLMMVFVVNAMSNVRSAESIATKNILKNGWWDINQYRNDLKVSDLSAKRLQSKATKDLVGKTIRFSGYVKLLKPSFAKDFDYYLTKELEIDCLPIVKSNEYCGKDNPEYLRVVFSGNASSKRDMDIMLQPDKNKYISQRGEMSTKSLDEGNYQVRSYNKPYHVQAVIKNVNFKCLDDDCNNNAFTIHIDDWKFTKLP